MCVFVDTFLREDGDTWNTLFFPQRSKGAWRARNSLRVSRQGDCGCVQLEQAWSRFHWFDAALIGYAVATIFATAAVTYKYTFWLARPPTGRYWRRSWQLFLSYANFRRYTVLIPAAISLRKRLSVGAACIAGSRTSASSGAWCSPV